MPRVKKKSRRWKGRVLLISLLCGVCYFIELRYEFFRLRDIEIIPGNIVQSGAVWQAVPRDAELFWPALFLKNRLFTSRIEGFYPVEVKLRLTGWGRFRVSVEPLQVDHVVAWNGRMWYLSTNGRMWLANLRANGMIRGLQIPQKPILAWDSGLAMPIDPERQMGDIYPSSLPLVKIARWYDAIEKFGWYDDIYCLLAKKIDGRPVVQVLLGSEEQITGEVVLKEDTRDWLSLAAALEEIFPNKGRKLPPGLVINATFADMKFIVTSKDT